MGLTLIAIFTAALLLPGIVAARSFYWAAQTREVDVVTPSLSSSDGIALVGCFSVAVHFFYVAVLMAISKAPSCLPFPLANPYALFAQESSGVATLQSTYAFISGLAFLCLIAVVVGYLAGRVILLREDKSLFYGPLTDIIHSAQGDDTFIVAYIISKIAHDSRLLGYQGTVVSLFRDDDRYPSKVILKDVAPFYLEIGDEQPTRRELKESIDWLTLAADDWHNIAFRVYRLEDDISIDD